MSIEQAVVEKLRVLPPNKQQEVLDFVEFLEGKTKQQEPNSQQILSIWMDLDSNEELNAVPLED